MKAVIIALFASAFGCAFVHAVQAAESAKYTQTVLYSFCSQAGCADGRGPAGLTDVNGTLYGTTVNGGGYCVSQPEGCGTVFSLDPDTGAETVLYAFCANQSCGTFPNAGLIDVNGWLYGTVYGIDGLGGLGAVFAVKRKTGTEKVVYSFGFPPYAAGPTAGLLDVNGTLYGTTSLGGNSTSSECYGGDGEGCGAVYSLDRKTGAETLLYSFCSQPDCTDGDAPAPNAGLIDVSGVLYGTTDVGGANHTGCYGGGCGTVFSFDPNTGAETVLYSFCSRQNCTDGEFPFANLIDVNGVLYGSTTGGGSNYSGCGGRGCGTVFSLDPNTGTETVLYSFCSQQNCADGAEPQGNLINVDGKLFGTASKGGNAAASCYDGCGTVFSIDLNTGAEKVIYSFCSQQNCTDGADPSVSLIHVNGTLYGTTSAGGLKGFGTAFALKKKS